MRALIPYHGHLLLLLNHVVNVVKLYCVEALWKIDVNLISTLVYKTLYYYYILSYSSMGISTVCCSPLRNN